MKAEGTNRLVPQTLPTNGNLTVSYWNGHRNNQFSNINSMVSFHSYVSVYHRVLETILGMFPSRFEILMACLRGTYGPSNVSFGFSTSWPISFCARSVSLSVVQPGGHCKQLTPFRVDVSSIWEFLGSGAESWVLKGKRVFAFLLEMCQLQNSRTSASADLFQMIRCMPRWKAWHSPVSTMILGSQHAKIALRTRKFTYLWTDRYICIYIYICIVHIHIHIQIFVYIYIQYIYIHRITYIYTQMHL